jgi:DNA-binding CsgD family transcriptional regulator/tetratricopeptide (TPR) repeat protein
VNFPPVARWPFVGRQAELDQLRTLLADAEVDAVVLTGPPGAGKTRLAAAATDVAAVPALWWHAGAPVRTVPFGAIADLVGTDAADPAAAFERMAERVRDAGGIVVVDDAPYLDARSADLLARLVDRGKATVLATARDGVPVPTWLEWLWLGERTVHVELGPLDASDVDVLVDVALDEVDAAERGRLSSSLLDRTGGNALFVRELLMDQALRLRSGQDPDPSLPLPERLAQVLATRLADAGANVGEAVARVALLGSLPLSVLSRWVGEADLAAAERAGYLVVEGTVARPAHPLHGDAALAQLSGVARARITDETARAVLDDPASGETERLAAVQALVERDLQVDVEDLASAARTAFGSLDHELADRLATAAIAAGDRFESQVVAGAARSALGRPLDAEQALRAALAGADTDDRRARAAGRLAVHLLAQGDRSADAAALLDEVLAQLTDQDAIAFLSADRAKVAALRGESTEPWRYAAGTGEADDLSVLNQAIVVAYVQAMAGDADACRATLDQASPLATRHRDVLPWSAELLRFSETFAELLEHGPKSALARSEQGLVASYDTTGGTTGTWQFLVGFHAAIAGHLQRAEEALRAAELALETHDLIGARGLALAARAWVHAQGGDVDAARSLLDRAVELAEGDGRVRAQLAVADAWCDAVEAGSLLDGPAPTAVLVRLVDEARTAATGGQGLSALVVLHECVRLGGAATALGPLEELADELAPSWFADAVLATARAALHPEVSTSLHGGGASEERWPLVEAEALAIAARHAASTHDDTGAARCALRSLVSARGLGARRPLTLTSLPTTLTPREVEVAAQVGSGATSREVATAAGVSVRTVENQLQSVYRKLDLAGREELGALLRR